MAHWYHMHMHILFDSPHSSTPPTLHSAGENDDNDPLSCQQSPKTKHHYNVTDLIFFTFAFLS